MIFNHLVTLCHIINKKHSISSSVRLTAIKLDRVVTEGGGLWPMTLFLRGHLRSPDKLKTLDLLFHQAYDHKNFKD